MDKLGVVVEDDKTKTGSTVKSCPSCGAELSDPKALYCNNCGTEPWEKKTPTER